MGGPRPLSHCSQRTRENAARNAARELRHHGISYLNGYVLTAVDDEPGISWLADIAQHVDSLDPIEIGGAALLEAQGYQRTNVQLALDQGGRPAMTYDTDHAISEPIAVGREHHARERFGDARVDQWFRDNGINPDAVRGTEYRPSLPERSKSPLGGPYGRKAHAERRAARLRASVAEVGLFEAHLARCAVWRA